MIPCPITVLLPSFYTLLCPFSAPVYQAFSGGKDPRLGVGEGEIFFCVSGDFFEGFVAGEEIFGDFPKMRWWRGDGVGRGGGEVVFGKVLGLRGSSKSELADCFSGLDSERASGAPFV